MLNKQNTAAIKVFFVRRADVQNSTVVLQLNISDKFGFCASIFRPNAMPQGVKFHDLCNKICR